MSEGKMKILYSNKPEFKNMVMQYAKKNIGRSITYGTFTKWLENNGYNLSQFDTYWKAVFKTLLQRNFQISLGYRTTDGWKLITVFQLIKSN